MVMERFGAAVLAEVGRADFQDGLGPAPQPELLGPFDPPVDLLDERLDRGARDRQSLPPVSRIIHPLTVAVDIRQRSSHDLAGIIGRACGQGRAKARWRCSANAASTCWTRRGEPPAACVHRVARPAWPVGSVYLVKCLTARARDPVLHRGPWYAKAACDLPQRHASPYRRHQTPPQRVAGSFCVMLPPLEIVFQHRTRAEGNRELLSVRVTG